MFSNLPRLTRTGLITNILTKILTEHRAISVDAASIQMNNSDCFNIKFFINSEYYILLSPAHDGGTVSIKNGNVGTIELSTVLALVKTIQPEYPNASFFIPLAECRGRAHWVLLRIQRDHSYFYDPRGILSLPYDISPIENHLRRENFLVAQPFYTGLQLLLDDTSCGYIVAHLVSEDIKHRGVALQPPFSRYNNFSQTPPVQEGSIIYHILHKCGLIQAETAPPSPRSQQSPISLNPHGDDF